MAQVVRPGGFLGLSTINKFVYERSGDIGPPRPGQVRRWLSKSQTLSLLAPRFDINSVTTVEPRGEQGILRLVNSHKLNVLLGKLIGADAVRRTKERCGLGGGIVFIGRRRAD